ncbi:MAG: OmpH family outer membrane protein [Rhodospirillaceae bacterium]|nr:OmpH family outer membrane protein [Rhodospirillales bacterium]
MGARLRWALLAVAFSLATSAAAPAAAETPAGKLPQATVMVLDVQAALQQSVASKSVRAQRDQYLQTFQAELEANRRSLKDTEAELIKQKSAMAPDVWAQKARTFEQQVYEFNQRFQRNNQAVEKSFRAAMSELSDAMAQVTEEVAGELGANLVLPKSQIFLHDPRMELTQTVIDRLNKKHPSVNFPAPTVEGEPGAKSAPPAKKK